MTLVSVPGDASGEKTMRSASSGTVPNVDWPSAADRAAGGVKPDTCNRQRHKMHHTCRRRDSDAHSSGRSHAV